MADWRIERLDPSHERGEFCCGKAPLDEFLRSLVSQYEKRNLGRTYVVVKEKEKKVYGYYTLASSAVPFANVPPKSAASYPAIPFPSPFWPDWPSIKPLRAEDWVPNC